MSLFDRLSSRCFALVHGHNLVYNTCWEDPRLDRVALELGPDDDVLVITSAGCNALDYALQAPRHVYAVDMNPRQNALLELKQAAIRALDYDTFFQMFGQGRLDDHKGVYQRHLRDQLTPRSRSYWDRRIRYFRGTRWQPSFYFHGTSGVFARIMNFYVDRVAKVRDEVNAILAAETVAQQREIYERHLRDAFWKRFIRWFLRRDSTLSLVGVPRQQRMQVDRDYDGGIGKFIEDCVEAVFADLPLADNYFWRVYLCGHYTPECCPEYLKRDNFAALKSGLVDRVSTHTCSALDFLEHHEGTISRYVLLDHMDWLSATLLPSLEQEWQAIVDRAAPNTRILWRSGGLRTDFVDAVRVQRGGKRHRVGDLLTYHRELAAQLHEKDRVHTYGSFYIADLTAA
jgi:S-adenosylmethionine-diacylglycerol 3-amino-3-carboxypropyl transferase